MWWWTYRKLLRQLQSENSYIREVAIEKLGNSGSLRALEPLAAVLKNDKSLSVRKAAAEGLGKIGKSAVDPLVAALKDKFWEIQIAAITSLERIGDARVVEPLMAVLEDPEDKVRRAAAKALKSPRWQLMDDVQRAHVAIVLGEWQKAVSLGPASVEPLLGVLKEQKWDRRREALRALESLGWQPINDAHHAHLAIAHSEWEKVIRLGAVSVEPLTVVLKNYMRNTKYQTTEANNALIKILTHKRVVVNVETNDLRAITGLEDITEQRQVGTKHFDGYDYPEYETDIVVSFSQVRQLAQQELARRGVKT